MSDSQTEKRQVRALRARAEEERKAAFRAALSLAERAETDAEAAGELEFALGRVEKLDRRLSALPKVEVTREPGIYDRHSGNSFFRDLAATVSVEPVPGADPNSALERLQRHQEHESQRIADNGRAAERMAAVYGIRAVNDGHSRALASNVAGSGGVFSPPQWILDDFSSVARAACPLRGLVKRTPLPPHGSTMSIPRVTAVGGVVAPNASENIVPPTDVTATDSITANVATFSGEIVVSQALYERGPAFDSLMAQDFGESFAAGLASEMMNGPGTTGRMLGLLSVPTSTVDGVPGAQVVSYTSATPTRGRSVRVSRSSPA